MPDLDTTLRAALDAATSRAIAPPLRALEHRARVRRVRRTATAAAAVVVATAGIAVAVPRLDQPATRALKPLTGFDRDRHARTTVLKCLRAHEVLRGGGRYTQESDVDACLRAAGYQPLPRMVAYQCLDGHAASPVAGGDAGEQAWRFDAYLDLDRHGEEVCGRMSLDGRIVSAYFYGGGLRHSGAGITQVDPARGWWALTGTTPANVTRVTLTFGHVTHEVLPVQVPGADIKVFGLLVHDADGELKVTTVQYDAAGDEVSSEYDVIRQLHGPTASPDPAPSTSP